MKKLVLIWCLVFSLVLPFHVFAADSTTLGLTASSGIDPVNDVFPYWDAAAATTKKANVVQINTGLFSTIRKWVGMSSPYDTFAGAVTALNADGNNWTLEVPRGAHVVNADLTVNANINLRVDMGADIQIATTKTLAVNGMIDAGPYQIFSLTGTGKAVFPQDAPVYSAWWNNDLNQAFAALPHGGEIKCSEAFDVTAGITVPVGTADQTLYYRLAGTNRGTVLTYTPTDGSDMFTITGTAANQCGLEINNLYLKGNASAGNCIKASYMYAGRMRLINSRIQTWGGSALEIDNSYGVYIDPGTHITDCNLSSGTGTYAIKADICSGFIFDGIVESTTRGGIYVVTSSCKIGGIVEVCGEDNVTLYSCDGFDITTHAESGGTNPPNLIVITGTSENPSQGGSIHGGILTRSSDTTYTATKAPIYLDYARGIDISGNEINPNDGSGNSPHAYVTANARAINFGMNRYKGNLYATPVNPSITVAAGAKDIQFSYLVPRTYTFMFKALAASQTNLNGKVDSNGDFYTFPMSGYRTWITGINVQMYGAVTAGIATFYTSISGGTGYSALTAVLNTTNPTVVHSLQYPFQSADFMLGSSLSCYVTTDGEYNTSGGATADVVVTVEVLEERAYNL